MITGAGSGIGRALALDVARRGALLALSDVDEAGLAETVDLVKAAGAREVRSDRLDVADRAAIAAYADAVAEQFGRVNVVVNNAGVALAGDVEDLDYDDIDWIIGVNFWGVVHGTKEFLPHLIASGDGHVVNLSSLFGLISMPGQSMYNAAEVRRPRLHRGAARGDADRRPPGRRHLRAPRRHQDRDRPQRAAVAASEDQAATAALFDEKLAKMTPERAAEIIVKGDPRRQGPGAGRPRRARAAPLRPAHRLPLPGRRRRGRRSAAEGHRQAS